MKLVNTTAKNITLFRSDIPQKKVRIKGKAVNKVATKNLEKYMVADLEPELPQITVREIPVETGEFLINGEKFPVVNKKEVVFENLPPEMPGVIYITSARVCRYISKETKRHDFVYPNELLARVFNDSVYVFIGTLSFERV